jgi:hypothetical protein
MPADITLNPDVVSSTLDGGGVLLDLVTKQYFALNVSGLAIWQHLEDGGTLAAVYGAAGADQANAIEAFTNALLVHQLAQPAHASPETDPAAPAFAPPAPWDTPSVTPHGRPLSQVILSPFDPTVPIPE